jgi:hypothetical protein
VLGISPWPSLSNAGEEIKLRDQFNNVIDSVFYLDSWHSDATKKQGGWSLERISPTSTCQAFLNWESAKDQSGINSYFEQNGFGSKVLIINLGSSFVYLAIFSGIIVIYMKLRVIQLVFPRVEKLTSWLGKKICWEWTLTLFFS